MNKYLIGIDTGGTFTDGVLMQYRTRKVIRSAKTLTTKDDLKKGVLNVLDDLHLEEDLDIRLVGISSTLATNSIAEGKASRVGLILLGYDKELVEDYGLDKNLAAGKIAYFSGGHNAQGAELEKPDIEGIKKWVKANEHHFDALAISSYFSPLNPQHEVKAFKALQDISDLPVVMGHQLSSRIDSVKRAATAAINASLVAVMQNFISAVRNSLHAKGIKAPLMIVRGDGTMMPFSEAIRKPVETVLSGPAASAIGGRFLSGKERSLVIDVGSTTTDMALVANSRVVVSEKGARVGKTQTAVNAANVRTISMGCDSRIGFDKYNHITLGPDRVTPLSQMASRFKKVKAELKNLKNIQRAANISDVTYWYLYRPLDDHVASSLNEKQHKVLELIDEKPMSVAQIVAEMGVYHPAQLNMDELIKQEYIECSALTPSDLLHVENEIELWDQKAAINALKHQCKIGGFSIRKFIDTVIDKILNTMVEEIIIYLACQDGTTEQMPEKIDGEWGKWMLRQTLKQSNEFISINLNSMAPIIGTGAPAEFFLKRAVKILDAQFILPEHHEVANAVGAVSGSVMEIMESIVFEQESEEKHCFVVKLNGHSKNFEEFESACDYASSEVGKLARQAVSEAGAVDPFVELTDKREGSIHRFIARAVGNPSLSEKLKQE
ncbi:MAG: hydantoinase/oxoprolinase family protein [Bacteroidales bacterium]|nr:hydantoinase/oxoprolinase family protein [Bacteroidales bacterium]